MKLIATPAAALLVLIEIVQVSPAAASAYSFLRTNHVRTIAHHNNDAGRFLPLLYATDRHTVATVTQVATCPPKTGQTTNIIADAALYKSHCEKGGLMDMFTVGAKGVIGDVDLSGEGSVFLKGADGTDAWAPIRALQGLENCVLKGGTVAPVAATTTAPSPPPAASQTANNQVSAASTALTPAICTDKCSAMGHMNNDPATGSDQVLSCSQACMIRARGSSETECKSYCNRNGQSGCSLNVNGHSYGMCAARKDYSSEALNRLMANEACRDGCSMEEALRTATKAADDDPYPTSFLLSGCRRMTDEIKEQFIDPSGMTHSKCFARCRTHKGARQFAIMNGGLCICSTTSLGDQLSSDNCDTRCAGDNTEFCGGVTAASVFTMIDCSFTVDEEKEELATTKTKMLNSYARFEEKTCGRDKDNVVELDGSSSLAGTVDQCKLACWQAKGAQQCQGFTYDSTLSQCTFHVDVFAGTLVEKAGATCFWKKI